MKLNNITLACLLLSGVSHSGYVIADGNFSCFERADKEFVSKVHGGDSLSDSLEQYPWMVNLNVDFPDHPVCGGTLINKNLVLTAAHCLTDKLGEINVDPDKLFVRQADPKGSHKGELRNVAKMEIHEEYNPGNNENDIALLLLDKPFEIGSHQIIRMLNPKTAKVWGKPDDCAKAIGWGLDESNEAPEVIRGVNLKIHKNAHCIERWEADDGNFPDSVICAGYDSVKKDVCRGDSGGPLFVRGGPTQHLLVGLVSWGEYCSEANEIPGAYTRVSYFDDWVRDTAKTMQP